MFSSESSLLCHQARFPGFHKFPCDKCGDIFLTREKHDRHISTKHSKIFTCDICSKEFSDLEILRSHIIGAHTIGNAEESPKLPLRKNSKKKWSKVSFLKYFPLEIIFIFTVHLQKMSINISNQTISSIPPKNPPLDEKPKTSPWHLQMPDMSSILFKQ